MLKGEDNEEEITSFIVILGEGGREHAGGNNVKGKCFGVMKGREVNRARS